MSFIPDDEQFNQPQDSSLGFIPDQTLRQPNWWESNISQPLTNFSTGFTKGGLSTLRGLGEIGTKGLGTITGFLPGVNERVIRSPYNPQSLTGSKIVETLKPQGPAEKIGYGAEKVAEFFAPAGLASKGERAINVISQGIKSPLLAAGARIFGKAGVQALATGGIRYAQTGGDIGETAKTAATAGIFRGGLATIGEGARALHIPERLYSTIFKNSSKDMLTELKANGIEALRRSDPKKFQEFVDGGIIKVGQDGQLAINDTLAERAIDRGLRGSIRHMANETVKGTLESEAKVKAIAAGYKGKVNLPEKQFIGVLKKIGQEYQDVGFGEISNEANRLASTLKTTRGAVDAETAVSFRRFLDRVRIGSSFDRPITNLSTSQGNLKALSDAVRTRVNNIPGMGLVMKDYSFYIDALEALAKEATRRGNNQVLSLIDSIFLAGAYAGNNPIPGLTAGIARRALLSGPGVTYTGQAIQKSTVSPLFHGLISAGSSGVLTPPTNQ